MDEITSEASEVVGQGGLEATSEVRGEGTFESEVQVLGGPALEGELLPPLDELPSELPSEWEVLEGIDERDVWQAEVDELAQAISESEVHARAAGEEIRVVEPPAWDWDNVKCGPQKIRGGGILKEPLIHEPIWQRQPGESEKCWKGFECWLQMDLRVRTLKEVARVLGYNLATMRIWSAKWSWERRSREYGAFLFSQAEDERLAQIRRMERKRAARQEALEENLWADYELLQEKARAILRLPLVEERYVRDEVGPDGVTVQHIYNVQPVRTTLAMGTQMLETGMKLAQSSLGMPTQRIAVEGSRPRTNLDEMDEAALTEHIEAIKKRLAASVE